MTDQNPSSDRGGAAIEAERAAEKLTFTGAARWMIILCTLAAIGLAVNQLFNLRLGGFSFLEGMYLYLLAGLFLSLTFITFRAWGPPSAVVPWYDWVLAFVTLGISAYFTATAGVSLDSGWSVDTGAERRKCQFLPVASWARCLDRLSRTF